MATSAKTVTDADVLGWLNANPNADSATALAVMSEAGVGPGRFQSILASRDSTEDNFDLKLAVDEAAFIQEQATLDAALQAQLDAQAKADSDAFAKAQGEIGAMVAAEQQRMAAAAAEYAQQQAAAQAAAAQAAREAEAAQAEIAKQIAETKRLSAEMAAKSKAEMESMQRTSAAKIPSTSAIERVRSHPSGIVSPLRSSSFTFI